MNFTEKAERLTFVNWLSKRSVKNYGELSYESLQALKFAREPLVIAFYDFKNELYKE